MNIGMITCNYFMRIYDYNQPAGFDWGDMCKKYHEEFLREDFIKLASEIRELGYDCLEIWEPMFSHSIYTTEDAKEMAQELGKMGFKKLAYCIGGWSAGSVGDVEKAYQFAKALDACIVTGCIELPDVDTILPVIEKYGKEYDINFAIENHPAPCIEKPEDVAHAISSYTKIGANLDTGIYNMLGYDVLQAADLLKDKIYHVHFKDTLKGGEDCLPIGDGEAPLAELLQKLKAWDYQHMVSVEFEHHKDPAPGLQKSIAFIRDNL